MSFVPLPPLDVMPHALLMLSGVDDRTTVKLTDAATKLDLTVSRVLHLGLLGQLELRRVGPYDALRITRRSLDRYLERPH